MKKKEGVIQDVRYEADAGEAVIHIDCTDGMHVERIDAAQADRQQFAKGMAVEVWLDDDDKVSSVVPRA